MVKGGLNKKIDIVYGTGDISFKSYPTDVINGLQIDFNGDASINFPEQDGWIVKVGANCILAYYNKLEEGHLNKLICHYTGDLNIRSVTICDNNAKPYYVVVDKISGEAGADKSNWSTTENDVQTLRKNKNINNINEDYGSVK